MASHSLAIAKASLTAGLIRPDPTSVPREDINTFHSLLDATLTRCSPANIQSCRAWLVQYVRPSRSRVTVVAKYLVSLAASPATSQGNKASYSKTTTPRRRQLHILYLLNDLLHDSLHHSEDPAHHSALASNLQPHLGDLCAHAAAHKTGAFPRQHRRVTELLDLWQQNAFYPESYIDKLREIVAEAGTQATVDGLLGLDATGAAPSAPGETSERKAPYMMPNYHGDPSAPYYELPAATMLPHIRPNTSAPINPQAVKALHFGGSPANAELAQAVEGFLKDAEALYAPAAADDDEGVSLEMDDIGQPILRDKATNEVLNGESYYGWSKSFCQRMKGKRGDSRERGGGGRSRSSSRSRSPLKRRRYASKDSHSRSPSRDRRRRRDSSYTPSRSRSRFRSRERSRSVSYSPPQQVGMGDFPPPTVPPPPPAQAMPFQNPFPNGMPPLGPDGMPLPPPRPVGWQGPWPPPPPPLPGAAGPFGGAAFGGTGAGGVYGGSSDPRLGNRR